MIGSVIAILASVTGLSTYGIVVDHPVMMSQMSPVAEQSIENYLAILVIQRSDIQKRIWHLEDVIIEHGMNQDRKTRLWELRNEYERLEIEIANILYDGEDL